MKLSESLVCYLGIHRINRDMNIISGHEKVCETCAPLPFETVSILYENSMEVRITA